MDSDQISSTGYLQELYNNTQGNPETQVSMYDVGAAIGIDKVEAGKIAEDLMVQGYVELKTLAGGISITHEGLGLLGFSVQPDSESSEEYSLSSGPLVNDSDRTIIAKISNNIQQEFSALGPDFPLAEQIVLDLKAIDIHLMSPTPKTAVIIALFESIADSLQKNEDVVKKTGLANMLAP